MLSRWLQDIAAISFTSWKFYHSHNTGRIAYVYRRFLKHLNPVITDTLLSVNSRRSSFPCFTCQSIHTEVLTCSKSLPARFWGFWTHVNVPVITCIVTGTLDIKYLC